jgi:hypothetical protein
MRQDRGMWLVSVVVILAAVYFAGRLLDVIPPGTAWLTDRRGARARSAELPQREDSQQP